MTFLGDPRRLHQYLISLLPARCQHSSAGLARHRQRGAENSAGAAGGCARTGSAFAPSPRAAGLGSGRAAVPTMRGCTRLALLCALPWLLSLVAPGRPAPPPALRRDPRNPARGAEFDRIYSGVVSLPTENIYSFNYTSQPGQVRHSLPALPGTCPTSEPRRCSGSPGSHLGDHEALVPFLLQSSHCPSCRILCHRPGDISASLRASPAWSRALLGFAGAPVPRTVCGSRSPVWPFSREVTIFKAEKKNDHTSVPKLPWGRNLISFGWFCQTLLFHSAWGWGVGGGAAPNLKWECVRMDESCRTSVCVQEPLPAILYRRHTHVLQRSQKTRPEIPELKPSADLWRFWVYIRMDDWVQVLDLFLTKVEARQGKEKTVSASIPLTHILRLYDVRKCIVSFPPLTQYPLRHSGKTPQCTCLRFFFT